VSLRGPATRAHWASQVSGPENFPGLKRAQETIARRERRPVTMHGHAVLADGTTTEILLLDLSYEGCGVEIPVELKAGDTILLSVLGRGAIKADVRWYAKGRAGLVFRAEEPDAKQQKPRGNERIALTAEVLMRRLGKSNYSANVFDMSLDGCKVEFIERPRIEEHVLIKFAGLEILDAEVCWVEGFRGGLRFEKPIHPAVFDMLLARLAGKGAR